MNNLPQNIQSKVLIENSCWQWTGAVAGGYARLRFNSKTQLAHRVIYELLVGKIPKGMVVDHKCNNKSCVNPEHLDLVTQGLNVRRANGDGTTDHLCRNKLHLWVEDNIYTNPHGIKTCRSCYKKRYKEYILRKRLAA